MGVMRAGRTTGIGHGRRLRLAAVFVVAAVVVLGCGKRGPALPVARWEGTVTVGGKALPGDAAGTIIFMPSGGGGQAPPSNAAIVDGRYRADEVPLGKVTVIFNITRLTGQMVIDSTGHDPYPEREDLVPEQHRQGIAVEVAGDDVARNFDL
jgi:hypothetical protein